MQNERLVKITFSQSGGFAPIFEGCELDPATLPQEDATELRFLVERSGVMDMASQHVAAARDVRQYQLVVQTDQRTHRVGFDQLSVPASVRPLLEFLQRRSVDLLPDDSPT
jgi:hypothetical protein